MMGVLLLGVSAMVICFSLLATVGILVLDLLLRSLVVCRLSVSVLAALALMNTWVLAENGLLNFALLTLLCFGGIYLMSALLPRLNCALKTFCATLISMLVSAILYVLVAAFFPGQMSDTAWWVEALMKVACVWFVFSSLVQEAQAPTVTSAIALGGPVFSMVGRILASATYGLTAGILFCPLFGGWVYTEVVCILVIAAFSIGAFVADPFLFDQC